MRRSAVLVASVCAACGPATTPASLAPAMPAERAETLELEPETIVARPAYPPARREAVRDTLHGVEVDDPYRWLEDGDATEVKAWVAAQDELARRRLGEVPGREQLAARVAELAYRESVSAPMVRGGRWFYTRRHVDQEKAVVYWREGETGAERALLDPNAWTEDGSASLDGWFPSWDGRYVAYKRAENNADEGVLHVREVATGAEASTDLLAGVRYGAPAWSADSRGLYYKYYPTDPAIPVADRAALAELRRHRLGSPQREDELIMPATGSAEHALEIALPNGGQFLVLQLHLGWNATDIYVKDLRDRRPPARPASDALPADPRERVEVLARARGFQPLIVGRAAVSDVTAWKRWLYLRTNDEAPTFRVFRVDPRRLDRARWRELVPARADTLSSIAVAGNKLALIYTREAASAVELRELDGRPVRELALPGIGTATLTAEPDRDIAYLGYSSFDQPQTIYRTSLRSNERSVWAATELPFDPASLAFERVWYRSRDGTRVSMFLVHRAGLERDGKRPTQIYGYGGFSLDMTPQFSAHTVAWAERGGVLAVPNLRGGGEYGEAWHRAGMLDRKQNVFDDAIAAAEYLIREGYTRPASLAIRGGSNGGLLVGAVLTQRPELFAAAICQVPLLDMVRFARSGFGRTWIPEYGDPDDPEAFRWLYAYSPYHRLRQGTAYPAVLMLTADSDDRVDPLHARKFAAALQWATDGGPVLLRVERNAGHRGADRVRAAVDVTVDQISFLSWQLERPPP
jgi:prolyl oligopeptidase